MDAQRWRFERGQHLLHPSGSTTLEAGDVLFVAVNIVRRYGVDAEEALRIGLVSRLVNDAEIEVEAMAAANNQIEQITGKPVTFVEGDVLDRACLQQLFANHQIESVIHFARVRSPV